MHSHFDTPKTVTACYAVGEEVPKVHVKITTSDRVIYGLLQLEGTDPNDPK